MQADQALVHPRTSATAGSTRAEAANVRATASPIKLSITHDLGEVEQEWRQFERQADCTVFQCFDWLSSWHKHVGALTGACPAIVVGRRATGDMLFILPLAVQRSGFVNQLTFLGRDLCDYNAPLLAPDFRHAVGDFPALWNEICALLHGEGCRHDVILLDKMPERVGAQPNPMLQLATTLNPSGAYVATLSGTWEAFYEQKRSSATRRRDRTKRKRLAESGEVRMVTPEQPDEIATTLETLLAQKQRAFARMGVADMFSRPGYHDFFSALADPRMRDLVHISRLDVGGVFAATNLGLRFRGGYYHVLASYDDGPLSRFGPGAAHLHDLMRCALEDGCSFFDFTIGDEPYKRDWSDIEIKLYDHVAAATVRGRTVAAFMTTARRAKRAIKHSEWLWPLAVRLRATLGSRKHHREGGSE